MGVTRSEPAHTVSQIFSLVQFGTGVALSCEAMRSRFPITPPLRSISTRVSRTFLAGVACALIAASNLACSEEPLAFDPDAPARGQSEMLPKISKMSPNDFRGGRDPVPSRLPTADGASLTACDTACRAHCDAQGFTNPANLGLCASLWGLGLEGTPIVEEEACRRLFADTLGRLPSHEEIATQCLGQNWNAVVSKLLGAKEFVRVNRRLWADRLRYDTEAVSVERVYDMDRIVTALYEGRIAYDQFAAVASAHPVLTRRHDTERDRAEALIWTFLGRPPFGDESADLGRLYHLWQNDYYDHPQLGVRLPDAYIRYACLNRTGPCTSTNFGLTQVILKPDTRALQDADRLLMWSGFLSADEWEHLQAPGRVLSQQWSFWEHAVNMVLEQYMGYPLATQAPEIGERLTRYLIDHDGDIRALHYAVLTSHAYLQSTTGATADMPQYAHGPLKQVEAEVWVDSLNALTGSEESKCDIRLNRPNDFLRDGSPYGIALVKNSDWTLNENMNGVRSRYRDLVQALGGCPDNSQGGRFKITSVLTTANQLNHAGQLCDPSNEKTERRVAVNKLLPEGVGGDAAVTEELAAAIFDHQTRLFLARPASELELTQAKTYGASCALERCSAEEFARPVCFALLSSAEMIFY